MTWIERWLVPGILVCVALTQITLSFAAGLTPWKGGGFGMFSSIDAAPMRTVRCEATTLEGETILIDPFLAVSADREYNMRAMPGRGHLFVLGSSLLGMEFVPETIQDDAVNSKLRSENPELTKELGEDAPTNARTLYRPVRGTDPEDAESVALDSVRLQWWKVKYDSEKCLIWTKALGEEIEMVRFQEGVTPGEDQGASAAPEPES